MASPITVIKSHGIDITGDYVVNSISSSGNVSAGNVKTDHLLHANGTPYTFTTNAAGSNTQVQFNDGNNFAGSANLTFDKTSGTLTANFFVGDGSGLTGLPASYTDTNANSAIDARVTKTFVDNLNVNANTLNGHSDTYFATSTQGGLADSAVQPNDNISVLTNDAGYLVAANLTGYATESYVGNAVANLINSAPGVLDTLGEIANAIGNDASFITTINNNLANKANIADLSNVAISGNYTDLNNLPTLFSGSYTDLTNKPTLFDGEYASLANKPTLFSGSYVDLTNKPTLFDGEYASLANKPTLFSGSYLDLTNKPTLGTAAATDSTAYATAAQGLLADSAVQPADLSTVAISGNYQDLNNLPTLFNGEYASLANKPTLFSGSYTDLTNKPSIPSKTSDLTNDSGFITTTALSGYATESYVGNAVANLVNSAPTVLDTLGELANALGNDASYSTTITNILANKLSTSDFTSTADTWLATKSTSNITEGTNQYYTISRANAAIDARVTKSFIDNLGVNANTLNGHSDTYFATSTQGSLADSAVQPGDNVSVLTNDAGYLVTANISSVGISGNYEDLNNLPTLFNGEYSSLANKPTLFSGSYTDLTNKPSIPAKTSDLTNDSGFITISALSGYATESYVGNAVANLVNSAPSTLDTLQELANALGNDASYSTTITNALANKLSTSAFTSTADTWLATKSTSDVTEGTNQYYTTDRANTAITNKVTKTFIDNLSVTANIANIALSVSGSNVSGPVQYAAIANSVAGSNVVGDVAGATHANVSDVANSVAVANVTGIGNIATINKDGNASNILYGNGVFASAPATYGNSNVATYLPTYTGNLSPGNLTISVANLFVSGGTSGYVLSTDGTGNLSWVQQSATSGTTGGGESTVTSVDTFTGDGTTVAFTLSVTPQTISQTFVNYNGAMQLRSAYTLSGAVITFSEAPANGSEIEVTTQMNVTSGSGNLVVRNYTADGVQTAYSVSAGVNETNILVTENGLLQTPTVDYTVSGSTLTFTSAPGYGVKIQIRELGVAVATITPVGSNTQVLFNDSGSFGNSSQFTFSKAANTLSVANLNVISYVTGNLVPNANVTYNLGSSTNRWKDLYLSGNTIDLAGAQIKADPNTGSIAFIPPTTQDTPNPTALVISPTGSLTPAATTNGVLSANAFTTALTTGTVYSPRYISMVTTGSLSVSTGTSRYYPPANIQIRGVTASLSTSSSSTFTFKLNKNGTVVGTYSIAANQNQLTTTSANIMVNSTDYLTVDITAVDGASELRIDLEYTSV